MHERGRVITVRDGAVDVRMVASAGCGGCSVCSHAGGETVMRDVRDSFGATVGDTVEVTIPDDIRLRAAMAVFLVPVAGLLLGYLAGFLLGRWLGLDPDIAALVLALVAANVAVVGIRFAERRLSGNDRFRPRVNAIIAPGRERP